MEWCEPSLCHAFSFSPHSVQRQLLSGLLLGVEKLIRLLNLFVLRTNCCIGKVRFHFIHRWFDLTHPCTYILADTYQSYSSGTIKSYECVTGPSLHSCLQTWLTYSLNVPWDINSITQLSDKNLECKWVFCCLIEYQKGPEEFCMTQGQNSSWIWCIAVDWCCFSLIEILLKQWS